MTFPPSGVETNTKEGRRGRTPSVWARSPDCSGIVCLASRAVFRLRRTVTGLPNRHFSTADLAGHHRSKQFPTRAVEPPHLHLFDRRKSFGPVLMMPGSSMQSSKLLRLVACFMDVLAIKRSE